MTVSQLSFSSEEYARRLTEVQQKMIERNVDVLIVDQVEHLGYLTGYTPTAAMYQVCLVPQAGNPIVLVRGLDEPTYVEQSWITDYTVFSDWENPIERLVRVIRKHGWANQRIAQELDSHFLLPMRYEAIKASLPEATFVDFSGVLWELRLYKSDEELVYVRKSAQVADAITLAGIEVAMEGVGERDVTAAVYSKGFELGADNTRMALVMSGSRSDALHGGLGNHQLERGDILHIEAVPHVRGYTSRTMRPTAIGTPSPEQQHVASELIRIQDEQFAAMKPGVKASEIDRICREQVVKVGLRDAYPNATGYTLGYVAIPRTSDFTRVFLPNSEWTLEERMVFHMYTWAKGMAFSETILVTQDGHERLTCLERKLFTR